MKKKPYDMERERLQVTKEERDIGVLATSTLNPGAQCAKARTVLDQLSRAFDFRDRHTFIWRYKQ